MEFKYTSDGKKVAVIGKLNAQETIVQEIFIVNSQEVPSGENFVVRSLHDAPSVSWKEAEVKKLDEKIDYLKARHDREEKEFTSLREQLKIKYEATRHHIEYLKKLGPAAESVINTLSLFLSGDIKYVIDEDYYNPTISQFHKAISDTDHSSWSGEKFEALRLLSVFGSDNGDLSFRVNQYRDGSGHSWTRITAFTDFEQAKARFREIVIEKGLNDYFVKKCKEYGISLPEHVIDKYKESRVNILNNYIVDHQKKIDEYTESINSIKMENIFPLQQNNQ